MVSILDMTIIFDREKKDESYQFRLSIARSETVYFLMFDFEKH